MINWKYLRFLDVFEDVSAGNIKTKSGDYLSEGSIPIIDQGQDLIGGYSNNNNVIFNANLPVIIFGDHTRIIKYVDFPFGMGADGVKVLKNKPNTDLRYLYHVLRNMDIPSAGYSRHFKFLKEKIIPLPPLEEQQRIAVILDKADALCGLRRAALAKLDELLQATFIEMFGDPVINPMRWKIGLIRDLAASVNYGTSKRASDQGAFPILRMSNITYKGDWNFLDLKYIDLTEEEQKKYLVYKNQILFNRTNSRELVGKTAVYREDDPMAFAGYLVRMIVNDKANPEYIAAFMNTSFIKQYLQNKCKSIIGMANINAQEFQDIPIPIPPIDLQEQFAKIIHNAIFYKDKLQNSFEKFNKLFLSLQYQAFHGDLSQERSHSFVEDGEPYEQLQLFEHLDGNRESSKNR